MPEPRKVQHALREDLAVGGDHTQVRRPARERLRRPRDREAAPAERPGVRAARAVILTGASVTFCPRPRGRSGWVTTPTTWCGDLIRCSSEGTANCGVPKNTTRIRYHFPARASFLILRTMRSFCRPRRRSTKSVPSR